MLCFQRRDRRLIMRYFAMAMTATIVFLFAGVSTQTVKAMTPSDVAAFGLSINYSLAERIACQGPPPDRGGADTICAKDSMVSCSIPDSPTVSGKIDCECQSCKELKEVEEKDDDLAPCRCRNRCCQYRPGRWCCP